MQGFCLTSNNVNDFLCKLRRKLRHLCERLITGIIKYKVRISNNLNLNLFNFFFQVKTLLNCTINSFTISIQKIKHKLIKIEILKNEIFCFL